MFFDGKTIIRLLFLFLLSGGRACLRRKKSSPLKTLIDLGPRKLITADVHFEKW